MHSRMNVRTPTHPHSHPYTHPTHTPPLPIHTYTHNRPHTYTPTPPTHLHTPLHTYRQKDRQTDRQTDILNSMDSYFETIFKVLANYNHADMHIKNSLRSFDIEINKCITTREPTGNLIKHSWYWQFVPVTQCRLTITWPMKQTVL